MPAQAPDTSRAATSISMSSSTSALTFDKNGVPQFDGQPHLLEEYEERCWDLFHGRPMNCKRSTPVHLRAGCTGVVYEAVRQLKHTDLMTGTDDKPDEVGMKLFLATVRGALSQEAPIQEWTEFEKILYSPTVWRSKGESRIPR